VKIWDLDSKESIQSFTFQEVRYNNALEPSEVPPPIRDMLQIRDKLVCSLGFDYKPGMIQFWDLLTGQDLFLIQ